MVQARAANLWSYIDVRDAGRACRLALEANLSGHQVMIIAAADTLAPQPTPELLAERFPNVSVKSPLHGNISLLSSARARDLIGFEAKHSWRDD
jgi:nucleoside-diphosphate-sugar epimerase